MKHYKNIISLIIFSFFIICAGGSFDGDDITFFIILFVVIGIFSLISVPIAQRLENKKKEELENKRRAENVKKELEFVELKKKFSYDVTSSIRYGYNSYILVNENEKKIMLNKTVYNFKDIITFNITDNSKVIYSPTTSTTNTDTGNMLGRAVIGGVLTGGVGAIIGATTAKQTTTTSGGESYTEHCFIVSLTIDSISTPIINLYLGNDANKTNEVCALLTVIINRNQSNN